MGSRVVNEFGLTPLQEGYAAEIACGTGYKDAYRKVYGGDGMKPRTLTSRASDMNRHPKIKARVAMMLGKAVEKTELKVERILEELSSVAFANIKSYGRWDNDSFDLTSSEHLTDAQAAAISSIDINETTVISAATGNATVKRKVKLKFHSKLEALDMLAKASRLYTGEPPEGVLPGGVNIHGPTFVFAPGAVQEVLPVAIKALKEAGVVTEDVPFKVSENGVVHGD